MSETTSGAENSAGRLEPSGGSRGIMSVYDGANGS